METYKVNGENKNKGIHKGWLWGAAILASMGWGTCFYQNLDLKDNNSKLKNKNFNLETEMRNDSLAYNRSFSSFQKKLDNKTNTLDITDSLYKGSVIKNKNLISKNRSLRRTIVNLEKALKISENLEDPRFQEQFKSFREELTNALKDSMSLDSARYTDLEFRFDSIYGLYQKKVAKKSEEITSAYYSAMDKEGGIRNLKSNNKRWFHDWKFIKPKLDDWGIESVRGIDNNSENMYAFVLFGKEEKSPLSLERISRSNKTATFYWGEKVRNFEGPFKVYFYDEDNNESKQYGFKIKDGDISRGKIKK